MEDLRHQECPRCYRVSPLVGGKPWCAWCLDQADVGSARVANLSYRDDLLELAEEQIQEEVAWQERERLKEKAGED